MEIKLLAQTGTDINHEQHFDKEKALSLCGKMAAICYMGDDFDKILNEPDEKSITRALDCIKRGHHSVMDHFKLTFEFSKIPKIIAMFLNNEKDYVTSEKSFRYTKPTELPEPEQSLYFKWLDKLCVIIKEEYPEMYNKDAKDPEKDIKKLAQENARYFISIFTPITTMGHTLSLRQLNYLIYMFKSYIENEPNSNFNIKMKPVMSEFISLFDEFIIDGLIPEGKMRRLSLFGEEQYKETPDIFSYVYQTSDLVSLACVAQNHRHRSEHSFIYLLDDFKFYVPEILKDENLKAEWLSDAKLVQNNFPQGLLVNLIQTGNIDTLDLKARERVCKHAQIEVMKHTVKDIEKFISNSSYGNILKEKTNNKTARCGFKGYKCTSPCRFGINQSQRKI